MICMFITRVLVQLALFLKSQWLCNDSHNSDNKSLATRTTRVLKQYQLDNDCLKLACRDSRYECISLGVSFILTYLILYNMSPGSFILNILLLFLSLLYQNEPICVTEYDIMRKVMYREIITSLNYRVKKEVLEWVMVWSLDHQSNCPVW